MQHKLVLFLLSFLEGKPFLLSNKKDKQKEGIDNYD